MQLQRVRNECPLGNKCLTSNIVYEAKVSSKTNNECKRYLGASETSDDDYAHGHLSTACFFVPRHKKVFDFFLIRFENLKISLPIPHVVFSWTYMKMLHGELMALALNTL